MARATRESLPGLVLDVTGRPGPPPLRFETDGRGGIALRQGDRPVLLGRYDGDHCCRELDPHRLPGYRSPLPPLRAAWQRSRGPDRSHWYARRLEDAPRSPLHDGRWQLAERPSLAPGVWTEDFVRDRPGARLELLCGGGWHGVLPLRRLSPPDAPRVKAYRKHARDGTLAPVLLWRVSPLDGWVLLDGHDRAVAALAEGREPASVELIRLRAEEAWRRTAAEITEAYEEWTARPGSYPHRSADRERGHGAVLASLPYDEDRTPLWPGPVVQFPGD
ncbi:hypothetical protein ABZZ79_13500 [Streptomyces sp. NPDC006458]|uniref:hypothetical protein n=1 Tax=Streptomyces sp. NPDC006458 TaxID=3154302 RepID=UPI0033BD6506